MDVAWSEPEEWKRNGVINGYSIVYNELKDKSSIKVMNITNPKQLKVVLQELKMFTHYEIRVRAIGEAGLGPLSIPVVDQTDQDRK